MALDAVAHGHADGTARVDHLGTAHQTVGGLHGDGAHEAVAQVLRDLKGQHLRQRTVGDVDVEGIEQLRHGTARELHVDDGPSDADNAPGVFARGGGGGALLDGGHGPLRFLVI